MGRPFLHGNSISSTAGRRRFTGAKKFDAASNCRIRRPLERMGKRLLAKNELLLNQRAGPKYGDEKN
jgi:hypothetical protein